MIFKKIKIIIEEEFFKAMELEDDINGVAYPMDGEIFVREPRGDVILHELIHMLEDDSNTRKGIVRLFDDTHIKPLDELLDEDNFVEKWEDILDGYPKEDFVSEIYAYDLVEGLLDIFNNDSKEAIGFLRWFVEDITGVYIQLEFKTLDIEVLNIEDEVEE